MDQNIANLHQLHSLIQAADPKPKDLLCTQVTVNPQQHLAAQTKLSKLKQEALHELQISPGTNELKSFVEAVDDVNLDLLGQQQLILNLNSQLYEH